MLRSPIWLAASSTRQSPASEVAEVRDSSYAFIEPQRTACADSAAATYRNTKGTKQFLSYKASRRTGDGARNSPRVHPPTFPNSAAAASYSYPMAATGVHSDPSSCSRLLPRHRHASRPSCPCVQCAVHVPAAVLSTAWIRLRALFTEQLSFRFDRDAHSSAWSHYYCTNPEHSSGRLDLRSCLRRLHSRGRWQPTPVVACPMRCGLRRSGCARRSLLLLRDHRHGLRSKLANGSQRADPARREVPTRRCLHDCSLCASEHRFGLSFHGLYPVGVRGGFRLVAAWSQLRLRAALFGGLGVRAKFGNALEICQRLWAGLNRTVPMLQRS